MAPRWVKKRDGRIQPYDEARIANGVLRAGRRAGSSEEVEQLAREMATSVTLYLTRQGDRAPETSIIATAVVGVLEDTGHGQIARMVRDWRDWRSKRQAQVRVRETSSGGDHSVEVLSLRAARPWSKRRIVKQLEAEAELEQEAAEEVARAVEERVFAAGLNQISSNLLRELIDGELFERGYSKQLGKLEVLGVPKPDLERLAFLGQGKAPQTLEDRVSRMALERFALDEIVEGRAAVAHRRGVIHLLGLGRPFRLAAGAVCAATLCQGAASPFEAARRLIRTVRGALVSYDLMFGLVRPERAFAPFVSDETALSEALEILFDSLITPHPDDLPPAPEAVFVVPEPPQEPAERRVLELFIELLSNRGTEAAGLRLILHVPTPHVAGLEGLLNAFFTGAKAGANFDLVLGSGQPLSSRAMIPWLGTIQVGLLNLAGIALAAGRGQRDRFALGIKSAVEAGLEGFHKRRRRVFASVVRPSFPLFSGDSQGKETVDPQGLADAMGVVGLDAAMRYLTGEGPADNPRVADLAREVLCDMQTELDRVSVRLGLGQVQLEDVPAGDAGIGLAALDLDRFPDAVDLLGSAAGWDTGLTLLEHGSSDVYADLKVRLWLSRKTGCPLVLTRPLIAQAADIGGLIKVILKSLGSTTRVVRRAPEAASEV